MKLIVLFTLLMALSVHGSFMKKMRKRSTKTFRPSTCQSFPAASPTRFRPCPTNDFRCITAYFDCNLPKAYYYGMGMAYLKHFNYRLPYFNATVLQAPVITGLANGKINELTVDKKKKNIVLDITFNNVWINGSSTFNYGGRNFTTDTSEFYEVINTYSVIDDTSSLDTEDMETVVDIPNGASTYILGTCAETTTDQSFIYLFESIAANQYIASIESFVQRGTRLIEFFVKYHICR